MSQYVHTIRQRVSRGRLGTEDRKYGNTLREEIDTRPETLREDYLSYVVFITPQIKIVFST